VISPLTRRDFLKLASLVPLFSVKWPAFLNETRASLPDQNNPNILILVFDALSAHNASIYGYQRETMPNLARFAQRAMVYHNHYAGGSFTSSGTASILTGAYPWSHRAFHLHDTVTDSFIKKNIFNLFKDKGYYRIAYSHNLLVTSLLYQFRQDLEAFTPTRDLCLVDDQFADRLFPNDFNVAFWSEWLITRGGETFPSSLFLSLMDRFLRSRHKQEVIKEFGELFPRGIPSLHNMFFILEDAINWLMEQLVTLPQPYLFYFHVLPPHEPYTTRKEFIDIFKDGWKPEAKPARFFSEGFPDDFLIKNRREYDEYLAYADAEFGRLYDFLLGNGVLDNTYVIFTSDHGEMFERGIRGHVTQTLYQSLTQVPLLVSQPGQRSREDIYTPTSCVDLLPTLLHVTGQAIPDWCEGEVLPGLSSSAVNHQPAIFTVEAKSNPKQAPLTKATLALVNDQYKLVHYFGYGDHQDDYELFDLLNDPEELQDLYDTKKSTASELKDLLEERLRSANQPFT